MRRTILTAAVLVASLTWTGCENVTGSYTKRHCDAFSEAWHAQDPALGEELLALTTPPEGETVETAVHDAALVLAVAALDPSSDVSTQTALLLFECERVSDSDASPPRGGGTTGSTGSTGSAESNILTRAEILEGITARLESRIRDQELPYVVWSQPSFSEATEEDAAETGWPAGTWLSIGLKLAEPIPSPSAEQLLQTYTYGPLELYAEAIRPYLDQMDFVVLYFLPWRFPHESSSSAWILIDPAPMRQYLAGDISVRKLSKMATFATGGA